MMLDSLIYGCLNTECPHGAPFHVIDITDLIDGPDHVIYKFIAQCEGCGRKEPFVFSVREVIDEETDEGDLIDILNNLELDPGIGDEDTD